MKRLMVMALMGILVLAMSIPAIADEDPTGQIPENTPNPVDGSHAIDNSPNNGGNNQPANDGNSEPNNGGNNQPSAAANDQPTSGGSDQPNAAANDQPNTGSNTPAATEETPFPISECYENDGSVTSPHDAKKKAKIKRQHHNLTKGKQKGLRHRTKEWKFCAEYEKAHPELGPTRQGK